MQKFEFHDYSFVLCFHLFTGTFVFSKALFKNFSQGNASFHWRKNENFHGEKNKHCALARSYAVYARMHVHKHDMHDIIKKYENSTQSIFCFCVGFFFRKDMDFFDFKKKSGIQLSGILNIQIISGVQSGYYE